MSGREVSGSGRDLANNTKLDLQEETAAWLRTVPLEQQAAHAAQTFPVRGVVRNRSAESLAALWRWVQVRQTTNHPTKR